MSKLRIALRVLGLTVIGVGLLILWAIHSFDRDFDKFITVTANDVSELGIAIRGAAGESLFTQETFPPSRPKSGTAPDFVSQAKELLASYRKDPEKFKKYASLFDTVMNAIAVRDALLKKHPPSKTPVNSLEIATVSPYQRLDAWGHPFCLMTVQNRIAVVSGGPEAVMPFSCDKLRTKRSEILALRQNPFQRPSGEVIFMVEPDSPDKPFRHELH